MLRIVLLSILYLLIVRAVWRLLGGVIQGATGRGPTGVAGRGVQMVRDPVCGTYIVPGSAVVMSEGRTRLFFCSTVCRDKYRADAAHSA